MELKEGNFINDEEKMNDFFDNTKEDFLKSYSYLTEQEYNNTEVIVNNLKFEFRQLLKDDEDFYEAYNETEFEKWFFDYIGTYNIEEE